MPKLNCLNNAEKILCYRMHQKWGIIYWKSVWVYSSLWPNIKRTLFTKTHNFKSLITKDGVTRVTDSKPLWSTQNIFWETGSFESSLQNQSLEEIYFWTFWEFDKLLCSDEGEAIFREPLNWNIWKLYDDGCAYD